ncbi:MAG: DEAD/DEAH box helicase, partial [Myxococcota bacterium]
ALEGLAPLLSGFDSLPHTPPPEDLATPLRSYQARGVDWLAFLREAGLGALLADDMGLGKTLQALCAVRGRTLVVAPTSVLHTWTQEIEKHRPAMTHAVYHGAGREIEPNTDIILTSYAVLRLDIDALSAEAWDSVVLDEAQAIKNPESQTAQAACRLQARFRVALTGTPVENRLDELWSQFHFLNRGLLGGRNDFAQNTANPIARGEPGAAERLRERLRPFVLRRLKRDVAPELPPRTEVTLYIELSEREREVYDSIRASTRKQVVDQLTTGGSVLAALEALLRLRQAACHVDLVPGQVATTSSKMTTLLDRLQQAVEDGHKALVFSQWTSLLDRVEPGLAAAEIPFTRLDGSTRDRAAVVTLFQDPGGPPVMLLSLKAGGSGLTLTAADHVFLLDPWWNPAVEDQAADRAHRIGQDRPVLIHRLVAAGTVEERILELQAAKRATADAALGGASRAVHITRDDLIELLR